MEVDDFNQLKEFVFDQSMPEPDEEIHIGEVQDVALARNSTPQRRVIRRRAREACVACHKRKVRCDALSRGHTCTNCRLDGIACAIRSTGKRMHGGPPGPNEEVPETSSTERRGSQLLCTTQTPGTISPFAVESLQKKTFYGTALDVCSPSSQPVLTLKNYVHPNSQTDMIFAYFDFIEAETLSHIAPEDFNFLERKGCFHLPSRPILDELVREYFLHVHPVLPVIDERVFWELYFPGSRQNNYRKIPLFVFRAMLFVSCSFAPEDTIRRLGFQTALEARTCMYRRAKLLYDFDTTSDPITLSQGALILTFYSSDREPMANTTWLRLAIQFANSRNVQMYEQDTMISSEERLIRKRLWWCLIIRDRILPLGVRRPIQITRDLFDFSQSRLSEEDLEPEFGNSRVYDRETKRELARIFVAQQNLAVELTDEISCIYPASGCHSFDRLDYNTIRSMLSKIERCKGSLDTWNSKFKESILSGGLSNKHKSIYLYSGLNSIYYQSAHAALCQHKSFILQADDSNMHDLQMKELGSALHSSIASISKTIQEFVQLDVAKYLPVSAVAYMALPIILNSLDLQDLSSTNARMEVKRRQLRLLNEAMDLCHDRYTGAHAATNIINKTIEAARCDQQPATSETTSSTSLVYSNPAGQDWFQVFVSKPIQYLRISFSVDISFSLGRYPDIKDLPRHLSRYNCLIPQSLMPIVEELAPDTLEEIPMLQPTRNSHLDYFDFSAP